MKFGEGLPEVSAEDWARTPDSVKGLLAALLERMAALETRVRELEDKLNTTSRNSSKPPSSDPPSVPPSSGKRSKRAKGGQKGHPRHTRALLPPEQVDRTHVLRPAACAHCRAALSGDDPTPQRHQQIEVPVSLRQVTEWQLHRLACAACGKATRAALPDDARGAFGPRLHALTALLVGRFKLSHREVPELLREVFAIEMSDGAVTGCLQAISASLEAPVAAVETLAREQAVAHVDETGWRLGARRAWVWVFVTAIATFFRVRPSRGGAVARDLIGTFAGVLASDRWAAYDYFPLARRQLCWAHLKREWQRFIDRGGADAEVGRPLLAMTRRLFRHWRRFRQGAKAHGDLRYDLEHVRRAVTRWLRRGAATASGPTAGTCREVLARVEALWTFTRHEGVDPTNNLAERHIRPAVIWRKVSYGSDSTRGARFAERMLTVAATLRQHGRNLMAYLIAALLAHRQSATSPPLIELQAAVT